MSPDWLLVDLGNSRLKWAWLRAGQRGTAKATSHDRALPLSRLLDSLWIDRPAPRRILVCSVTAHEINQQLAAWCQLHWGLTPEWFCSSGEFMGLHNAYLEPRRLGNDRWLAMLAARHLCTGPMAVIDCGTAMTIDLVNAQGQHQGGWILPGLTQQRLALLGNTAIRPTTGTAAQSQLQSAIDLTPGQDTASCIANGGLLCALGAIQLLARQLEGHPEWQAMNWMLTGGEAGIIAPFLPWPSQLLPELLLDGLALLAQHLDRSP